MHTPTDLQLLGRAFLEALVARLGNLGAAGVLMLLAAEMKSQAGDLARSEAARHRGRERAGR